MVQLMKLMIIIDKWHDEYQSDLKLYEYLGMTKEEYDQ